MVSSICCGLGVVFVLAIAALHASGFANFTAQMDASDASAFLKDMFPILYVMPSLYLSVLGAFGGLALYRPDMRRPIGFILAPAVLACGALALIIGEWVPMVVMGGGAALFLASALSTPKQLLP